MPRTRVYKCNTCHRAHEKPTGKNCQWQGTGQDEQQNGIAENPDELTGAIRKLKATIATMGQRLGQVEKKIEDKTSEAAAVDPEESDDEPIELPQTDNAAKDIQSARDLRRDYDIGREINRRLAELEAEDDIVGSTRTGSTRHRGKRSGAARTVQDTVKRDIDWPHFHIYTAPGAEPRTFEGLSVQEFVYGFMHMIDQPDARLDRNIMWDILKNMMEDATEYPWQNVRDFYWVVASHVENDRMEWANADSIHKLRGKHAQKHEIVNKKQATQPAPQEKLRYCGPYQRGACQERGDHAGQKHMCAFCYRAKGTPYPHPEAECRRKNGDELPKNARGGE